MTKKLKITIKKVDFLAPFLSFYHTFHFSKKSYLANKNLK